MDNRNSYKSIAKSISLFGGVKVFQILVSLLRNKVLAVLLGPSGMGIAGLILGTTDMIKTFTGCGLGTSAVRDVSLAYTSGNEEKISATITTLRKIVIFTGLLGALIVFFFARPLSVLTFGNEDFVNAFRIVSICLFVDQLCVGQVVLLQGTFRYKQMASATLMGSLIGLVLSIPLYYFFGKDGIVPVIVASSIGSMAFSWYYSSKIKIAKVKLTTRQMWVIGKVMIVLGAAVAVTGGIRIGGTYLTRLFISNWGNLVDVGLYVSGIAIATQYIDVVLGAMGTDYTPRLSALANDSEQFNEAINRQINLLIPIVLPLIVFFLAFAKPIIYLIYSTKFFGITGMIEWIMFAMFFRTLSWCFSYAQVAKGYAKAYFWNETISTICNVVFTLVGYKVAGFNGIGIAFFLTYVVYTIQMYVMAKVKFRFEFNKETTRIIIINISLGVIAFVLLKLFDATNWKYIVGATLLVPILYYSYRQIDHLIPMKESLRQLRNRIRK